MFWGDVQCVYCRCEIIFSGNNISYQNQQCASHNKEHQFPGMNILINKVHSLNAHLPAKPPQNVIKNQLKYPNILRSRVTGGVSQKSNGHNGKKERPRKEFKAAYSSQNGSLHQHDYKTGKNSFGTNYAKNVVHLIIMDNNLISRNYIIY